MIKLVDILENKILVPRRGKEERAKNYKIAIQKQIQQYIKDGSKGDLNLSNTPITSLPNNLKVGSLDLSNTKITSLPDSLTKVGGNLYLNDTTITSLPDNLEVRGGLDLSNTPLTSLPDNLKVGGDLDLNGTKITSLPNNLQLRGDLDLGDSPLGEKSLEYSENDFKQIILDKGGYVKGSLWR